MHPDQFLYDRLRLIVLSQSSVGCRTKSRHVRSGRTSDMQVFIEQLGCLLVLSRGVIRDSEYVAIGCPGFYRVKSYRFG